VDNMRVSIINGRSTLKLTNAVGLTLQENDTGKELGLRSMGRLHDGSSVGYFASN